VRIFAYEHITGGGCVDAPLPQALLSEARLMLRSLVSDLAGLPDTTVATQCDRRVDLELADVERHLVASRGQWEIRFDELVATSDAVWLIAPETGRVLESLSRRVVSAGARLLGSSPDAIGVTASKHATARALERAGVPAIPAFRLHEARQSLCHAWVAKPDDGCGCEDTRVFADLEAASGWVAERSDPDRFVVQPYVEGEAASLSALARDRRAWLLSVNRQCIEIDDGALRFAGSVVNAIEDSDGAFLRLAERVAQAIPGLRGYFGVDLILTHSGPIVVEVNPRLTTSYAGLSAALGVNVAALVVKLLEDDDFDMVRPHPGRAIAVAVGEE